MIRLGVNIDHVATLRNARGEAYPSPLKAALLAQAHGADQITVHLREDRRHIQDQDVHAIREALTIPLNLEMAATEEMLAIAQQVRPHLVTLVPERREEITTEGGLDVHGQQAALTPYVTALKAAGIRVSLFITADPPQIEASAKVGAEIVEFHTGEYAHSVMQGGPMSIYAIKNLIEGAKYAHETYGLEISAGHGLTYENVEPICRIPYLTELNIGHNIIAEAVFKGLGPAVAEMKALIGQYTPAAF